MEIFVFLSHTIAAAVGCDPSLVAIALPAPLGLALAAVAVRLNLI